MHEIAFTVRDNGDSFLLKLINLLIMEVNYSQYLCLRSIDNNMLRYCLPFLLSLITGVKQKW
jgi:hypothetical protein